MSDEHSPSTMKGCIARCSRGNRGLITEDCPQAVTYPDGTVGQAYVGYHLGPSRVGQPWSSREPQVERKVDTRTFLTLLYMIRRAHLLRSPRK